MHVEDDLVQKHVLETVTSIKVGTALTQFGFSLSNQKKSV